MTREEAEASAITDHNQETDKPKSVEADKIIAQSGLMSSAAGIIPNQLLELGANGIIHYRMVSKLAKLYNVETKDSELVVGISSIVSGISSWFLNQSLETITNQIPQLNSLSASMGSALINGFITVTTGEMYKMHFANGGGISDMSIEKYLDMAKSQLNMERIKENFQLSSELDFKRLIPV